MQTKTDFLSTIPEHERGIVSAMIDDTYLRFSKWNCAARFAKIGCNYFAVLPIYDRHIKAVDKFRKEQEVLEMIAEAGE